MTFHDLIYEKSGPIVLLSFNRPEKLNAFRHQTRVELRQALQQFARDPESRVMILTGEGRTFSAGADLNEVLEESQLDYEEGRERANLETYQSLTRELIALEKPVIAAINGYAVGVGMEVALACDLVIASSEAQFIFPEAQRGLFQTNGVMFILPRLVGFRRAMDMLMTGRTISAEEAVSIGMINYQVDPSKLMIKALELAHTCAQNAPLSMSLLKQIGWKSLESNRGEIMDLEVEGMLTCLQSEDLQEGLRAFMEKRKPVFEGK